MEQYLLLDIGGTFIKYALADRQAQFLASGKISTPMTGMEEFLTAVEQIGSQFQGRFCGCAVSMPGRIDTKGGVAYSAGVLSHFLGDKPLGQILSQALGVPAVIANDGKCAAAAESWMGALKGVENGAVIVFGTGIGGGLLLNGNVYLGSHCAAGELSALIIKATALAKITAPQLDLNHMEPFWCDTSSTTGLIQCYCRKKGIALDSLKLPTGVDVFEAVRAGEAAAKEALLEFARYAAIGFLSLQTVLDLEKIAIGGGISAAPELLPALSGQLDEVFSALPGAIPVTKPKLVRCKYGNDANLIGAYKFYVKQTGGVE